MRQMLTASALLLLACGQSDAEAWAAFCAAPSACTRPDDLGDIDDAAREARDEYIECVMGAVRSSVDNSRVQSTYEAALRDDDLGRIGQALGAAGVQSCPMLELIREDP